MLFRKFVRFFRFSGNLNRRSQENWTAPKLETGKTLVELVETEKFRKKETQLTRSSRVKKKERVYTNKYTFSLLGLATNKLETTH